MKKLFLIFLSIFIILPVQALKKPKFIQGTGYQGELPKIEDEFERVAPEVKSQPKSFDTFVDPKDLKKTPDTDPLFLDIIIKKDKISPYVNDIRTLIPYLQGLIKAIEENANIQRFNANVNMIDLVSRSIVHKYGYSNYAKTKSYEYTVYVSNYAKAVANIRYEANTYSKYMSYQNEGAQYSPKNIKEQTVGLKNALNETLFIIRQEQ